MLRENLLKQCETNYGFTSSWRQQVAGYIERCHLEDGGYFFARVPPSSALDTYFAVKCLRILGLKPKRPEAIAGYFLSQVRDNSLHSLASIFAAVEVMHELGQITDYLRNNTQRVMAFQNETGGFGAIEDIDIEVPSELETTYRAVRILKILGADFDEQRVARFVFSLLNPDGGYGRKGHSILASTFYATEIHKLLISSLPNLTCTRRYLRDKEDNWRVNYDKQHVDFIEHLFWLVKGLANLGEKSNIPDRVTKFVMACQRPNGGFARATIMGIPTLEYTFYALSILKERGGRW